MNLLNDRYLLPTFVWGAIISGGMVDFFIPATTFSVKTKTSELGNSSLEAEPLNLRKGILRVNRPFLGRKTRDPQTQRL